MSDLSAIGAAYLEAIRPFERALPHCPEDGAFTHPPCRYDLRRFGLIENVKPNWWRMTDLGRAVLHHQRSVRNGS